jgi:hypothetical protein
MEELFRFTLTRPADRTDVSTLPLERTRLQIELTTALPSRATGDQWAALQNAALDFITGNLVWIVSLNSQTPPSPIPSLKTLLAALQSVAPGADVSAWQTPIQAATGSTNATELSDYDGKLADLFLALLILRSIGPAEIDKVIRNTLNPPPPSLPSKVPANLQPDFAQILHDRPSLDDIANLLRMIDVVKSAISSPLQTLDDVKAALNKTLLLPPGIFSRFEKPIHAVGFTDLLVVKQHIARYELGEVARIENILKGESRDHAQKHTLSNERDTVLDTSTQTETDQELTTTDHVSLQNEIDTTLQENTKVDAGVHVQYDGGSVKAQADLTVGYDRSSSESKKFASNVAKDITQKAARKVTQKVQQTITTKIIETFEETQDQSFDNKTGTANVSGVYQWVEKVYLAQVFNYGKHVLFDIMVPEPAASLLLAAVSPSPDQKIPLPPDPLEVSINVGANIVVYPLSPGMLTDAKVANGWIGKYQVTGVEPFPADPIVVADAVVADGRDQSHGDIEVNKTIQLLDGYFADSVNLVAAWFTGGAPNDYQIDIGIGAQNIHIDQASYKPTPHSWGANNYSMDPVKLPLSAEQKSIAISLKTISTIQLSINFEIVCKPAPELIAKWQLQAYEKIVAAWQKLQADYEGKMSALQFQKGTTGPLGAADPETNRQVERTELKRNCIALLSNQPVHGSRALLPDIPTPPPPTPIPAPPSYLFDPNPALAETTGSWVRWFEQAFEWDKIGYVFYPYYWGRPTEWIKRLNLKNGDPLFLNFLQAGYARVVVPVRNGFEDAVNFYLLTGKPWMGGGLPKIWDRGQNPLYLPITEEMKELSGAPGDEKPVGDPWEIRLPTALIQLRDDGKLPMWKWDPPSAKPAPGTYPPSPSSLWSWSEDKDAEKNE